MRIKNIFDKFFYLEEDEEQGVSENPAPQKQQRAVKQAVQQQQPVPEPVNQQQQQQQISQSRFKRGRNQPQQPVNEVATVTNNVVSLQAASSSKNAKVVLIEPRVYAEAQDIAENIKNKRATIVNLQRIDREQGIRIIDFLSGTVYALGGDIQRVGTDIFLCTPENVEVSGEISDYIDI